MRFPRLETHDLEGTHVLVPDDLPKSPRVVVLPFQRWHQMLVDGWVRAGHALAETHAGLSVWELPALSERYAMGRFFIDGGMKAAIPDVGVRQHTLTAYTDIARLTGELGIPDYETPHVFLLDAEGEIVWRGSGQVSGEQVAALAAALDALTAVNS
jgi:hypothetical protein